LCFSRSTADEKIGKVVLVPCNTTTGTAGYENFTAITTNVTSGTANTITLHHHGQLQLSAKDTPFGLIIIKRIIYRCR
jgi:hypothetical protein